MTTSVHVSKADCVNELVQSLAEAEIDDEAFDGGWAALGVVVSALYRGRITSRYSTCPHCGFESMTANGTKLHVKRMHGDKK
jgi:hypothetical protein